MATVKPSPINADVEIIHSTFIDNPFLPRDYVDQLKQLVDEDENYYKIYALGEWGLLQRRIYTNYTIIPQMPEMQGAKWCYGLDYGLTHPTALIKIWLWEDRIYAEEKIYASKLTVPDVIEFLSHQDRGDIYGDPSSKMMNEEVRRAGYTIFDGIKDVMTSIELCQRQKIYIPESSVNLTKEIRSYQFKEDKSGHVLPEPVKFNDDAMDAMRYGIWGIVSRFGFPTQRPQQAGPIESMTFDGQGKSKNDNLLKRWMKRI